ncbi:MAG: hypothetical protein WA975_18155 [Mesorhizobium sp.]
MPTIHAIYGPEPLRDGEFPRCWMVGHDAVTKIEPREDNFGDHWLLWFDVYAGDRRIASMSGRHVAEIIYGEDA